MWMGTAAKVFKVKGQKPRSHVYKRVNTIMVIVVVVVVVVVVVERTD